MSFADSIRPTLDEKKPDKDMRAPIVKKEEIVWGKLIATGSFGEVYLGICRGKEVALKKLPAPEDEEEIEQILTEMEILIHVRHPSVVLFMGVSIEDTGNIVIVQELMECDLFSYLRKNEVDLVKKIHIAKQIAEGMTWLHGGSPVILHSDLKPENVLMDANGNAKICDFGLSSVTRTTKIERDGIIGTPLYMSPEALQEESIDKAADVYSFAVVIWAVINVQEPFSEIHDYDSLLDFVVFRKKRPDISNERKNWPLLADLMDRMWAPDTENRPNFGTILEELRDLVAVIGLPEESSQHFWKAHFNGELEVSWSAFRAGLIEHLHLDPVKYKVPFLFLQQVLYANEEQPVKIQKFNRLIEWFGPLDVDEKGEHIVDRIFDIFKYPWFYGPLTSIEARSKLSSKSIKSGSFLVRLNLSDNANEQPFRISVSGKKAPVHYIVKNKKSKFEISFKKDKVISSPDIRECVQAAKKALKLKIPAPGREKYDTLFLEDEHPEDFYAYANNDDYSDESF